MKDVIFNLYAEEKQYCGGPGGGGGRQCDIT